MGARARSRQQCCYSPSSDRSGGGTVKPFLGFGAQFFTQVFGEAKSPSQVSAPLLAELRETVQRLKPGHSRIAVGVEATQSGPAGRVERQALMDTIKLADEAGANVNLTWWHGPYYRDPRNPPKGFLGRQFMEAFADVIEEARERFNCVTHVTVQNEVNNQDIGRKRETRASMAVYNRLYRLLDAALKARADPKQPGKKLRDAIDLVGGDLLRAAASPARTKPTGSGSCSATWRTSSMAIPCTSIGRTATTESLNAD